MGAEVIKIETAEGKTMRTRPPVRNHCSTVFGQLNVGKHSFVLDLKSPQEARTVRCLPSSADLNIERFGMFVSPGQRCQGLPEICSRTRMMGEKP